MKAIGLGERFAEYLCADFRADGGRQIHLGAHIEVAQGIGDHDDGHEANGQGDDERSGALYAQALVQRFPVWVSQHGPGVPQGAEEGEDDGYARHFG